ncbi:OsmC family protein [Flavobacterium sp. LB2P53]|uniref:OsmC family protein n=1 Tax=Flavobacterium sp. LB2P53 TaxID=2497481 RepID=UPI000F824945|nr:OsmC family protein [Flavobacterium sp. LB2P53]RTY67649.1 OsmC family peroxiredoxin [Flavobacterium sp. LB2P53]
MSEHKVYLNWKNKEDDLSYKTYDRSHLWKFEGETLIKASAAPDYLGRSELVNPEEAFAASLASCHMLTFLAIASMKKYTVAMYEDNAIAILGKNEKLKMAVTTVYLRPNISFKGDNIPDKTIINAMHHRAHRECFIANSVLTEIIVEPVY